MKHKLWIFLALLLALLLAWPAGAAPEAKPGKTPNPQAATAQAGKPDKPEKPAKPEKAGKRVNLKGKLVALDAGAVTLTLRDGSQMTVALTADTQIKIPGQKDASLGTIEPGSQVMVQAIRAKDGSLTARRVLVIPAKPLRKHHVGVVSDYQPGASLTIETRTGEVQTFQLDENFKILPAERAEQLAVGARVTVISRRIPGSNTFTAQGVVIHPPQESTTP